MRTKAEQLVIENTEVLYRNFSGRERLPYNEAGDRNFAVVVPHEDPDYLNELLKAGWNIKERRDAHGDFICHLIDVKVRYGGWREPRIFLVKPDKMTPLTEATVNMLDMVPIESVDVVINPSAWNDNGKIRLAAYLDVLYVTLESSRFD